MGNTANVSVGDPLTIQEGYSGWWSPYSSGWGPRYGGGAAQNVVQESGSRGAGADDAPVPGQIPT
ncbi:MAG TPA: hypothetical protein VFT39_01280 [Vicinamibacterales bacterium]|nr:hypothetical protein [Vicinamibacterales bacterium]